jgi:hypothetical protein
MFGPSSVRYLGHLRVLAQRVRNGDREAALDLLAEGKFQTLTQACGYVRFQADGPITDGWFDALADAWADQQDLARLQSG